MIRTLILPLALVAVAATPVPAQAKAPRKRSSFCKEMDRLREASPSRFAKLRGKRIQRRVVGNSRLSFTNIYDARFVPKFASGCSVSVEGAGTRETKASVTCMVDGQSCGELKRLFKKLYRQLRGCYPKRSGSKIRWQRGKRYEGWFKLSPRGGKTDFAGELSAQSAGGKRCGILFEVLLKGKARK
ncbi:MAG: hypothetical protein ABI333_22845 [bacterium]